MCGGGSTCDWTCATCRIYFKTTHLPLLLLHFQDKNTYDSSHFGVVTTVVPHAFVHWLLFVSTVTSDSSISLRKISPA